MKGLVRPLGFSTRLALIVGAGFAALQAIMLILILVQSANQDARPGSAGAARLAAIVRLVEKTPEADRAQVLQAVSGREARFSLGDAMALDGYQVVDRRKRNRRTGPARSALPRREILFLEPVTGRGQPGLPRWLLRPDRPALVAIALSTGGHLLVEPTEAGRRRRTAVAILIANALLGLLVVAIVWLSTRRLAAPLEAIAERAESFASDLSGPPMDATSGPREARRMAEAFNRLRSDVQGLMSDRMRMLAAVAHDLKTYLTRLHMRTSLIDDPAHRESADRDIQHMATLIEDVILAARGDERPVDLASFDIGQLVADIIEARRDGGVAIKTAGVRAGAWAVGNAAGIRRALDNLIDNALAYGAHTEVAVSREQDRWGIAVIDHGPGLPAGFSQVALDPFTRGEPSRNRETGGAGLGLFIASTLVRQSAADLFLSETPGGGLTARIIIPVGRRV